MESRWTDKSAARHKHSFKIKAVVRLHMCENHLRYYEILKCEHCNSFINARYIPFDRSALTEPVIDLYSPHKWIIGFTDVTLDKPFE